MGEGFAEYFEGRGVGDKGTNALSSETCRFLRRCSWEGHCLLCSVKDRRRAWERGIPGDTYLLAGIFSRSSSRFEVVLDLHSAARH